MPDTDSTPLRAAGGTPPAAAERRPARLPGVDMARVVAIALVCLVHVVKAGGVESVAGRSVVGAYETQLLCALGYVSVDLFALVSGYLLARTRSFRAGRFLRLYADVWTVGLLSALVASHVTGVALHAGDWRGIAFPMTRRAYWYFSAYAGMYPFVPLLAAGMASVSRRTLLAATLAALALFSLPVLYDFETDAEQKAVCHELIQDALFHAGIILKDKMDHLRLSEKYLLRLTGDYPNYEHADEAWYHLYLLYLRQGDNLQANNCLTHLKTEHPESEWTTLLTDPYYLENAKFGEHIEDSLYTATYEAFKQDRADIVKVNTSLSEKRFPQGANRAKFLFIDGLSRLNDGDGDGCMSRLQEVVEKFPDSEVSPLAGMIIKGVQEGRRLHGGKFDIGDVWTMRNVTLTHDSTIVDTLSTERNQQFLFMLVYQPDSVNENQLLFEMARYNFTNYLVRNFEIQIDEDNGLRRMMVSGFLSYDEAIQYARQLYANSLMADRLQSCRSLVISEANLQLIGRQFSYDEYQQFYEEELVPMRVSKEQLLLIPEDMEQPDIEDSSEVEQTEEETQDDDDLQLQKVAPQKQQVKDFDFGDDFW